MGGAERTAWEALLATEKHDVKAAELDAGAVHASWGSAKAFERVRLEVAWRCARHSAFRKK